MAAEELARKVGKGRCSPGRIRPELRAGAMTAADGAKQQLVSDAPHARYLLTEPTVVTIDTAATPRLASAGRTNASAPKLKQKPPACADG